MNQSTMLKKKGLNPNKGQSPLKNLDVDMQYRSSAELANKFKIKREQLANERNDKAKKEQALISHKRKNFEDFIPQQGKSKLLGNKSVIQSSSRFHTSLKKDVTASAHATGTALGNGEARHDILDLPNCKQVKRKPVIPASTLDQFLKDQGIHKDDETKRDNNTTSDVEFMHTPTINEHNKGLDDRVEQEEFSKDKCDVLAKCPDGIPHHQFRQLIEYWKHPTVQAICEMNSQNRKKQKWRHRMGPINFARVRVALRAAKDNNEEPSKPEIFIATRTKTGKEIQADTQVAIAELQSRQNSGETADDAFRAVFGKEQPGRVRCYGRSVTTSSLKKDEEINNLKQKHADEITSLKEELREEMRHLFTQLLQNNPGLNFQDIPGCVGSNLASPIDASSAQAVKGANLPYSSGSAQDSVHQKENVGN